MSPKQPLKTCKNCGREFLTEADFLKGTSRWRVCDRGNLWFNCSCNSTITIIKGKFEWYSPGAVMSSGAASVFNTLPEMKKLPHLPSLVMELQQMLKDEKASVAQLANECRRDPIMAGKVLKIANQMRRIQDSPNIESLVHAITYIGIKSFNDIILAASLGTFKVSCSVFNVDTFWDESYRLGRIAEYLAHRFAPHIILDEAYIAGSLCELGKLVTALCFPSIADTLAAEEADPKVLRGWDLGEKLHDLPSHTILGEIGASLWGLPDFVIKAISEHHDEPDLADPELQLADILGFANQLGYWVALEPARIDQKLLKLLVSKFKLNDAKVEELVEKIMAALRSK